MPSSHNAEIGVAVGMQPSSRPLGIWEGCFRSGDLGNRIELDKSCISSNLKGGV